ncbi:PRA1 family protein B2 [Canna indica]|uniref:PRA1 family protein n=1 Tax=Canna indica TaxID=4628 RepID=A0AAQ3Q5G4_9LILI|nr:PRA1 family protein B2 [Canna indica]
MSSASAPPLLPISDPSAASSDASTVPVSTPAIRLFFSRISDSVRRSLADLRPWSELADRSALSRPDSFSDATSRIRKNLPYFRVNYAAVVAAFLAVSLVTNPFSFLLLLALLAAWCLLYLFRPADPPLVLFGRTFSDRETLGGLALISVLVVFLTPVGAVIISALVAGAAVVAAHGAFHAPDDLFLDEREPDGATGLMSFFGGATSSVGGPTVVAARV